MFVHAKGSPFDSLRLLQSLQTVLNFPDTEDITGENEVRLRFSNTF